VGDLRLNLDDYEHVYILGAGKASGGIAQALEEILADRIQAGIFVLKYGDEACLKYSRVLYGAHPLPDENSMRGALEVMGLADRCTERDLVFAGITGGSSALLSLPVRGVSLQDKRRVHEVLLLSGADIFQINAVRKHLSLIKGGWLADRIFPATLVNLTVSDVVGDTLDYITCPTVPDTSTFDDARAVLDEFNLWGLLPESAGGYLRRGTEAEETPKDFSKMNLHSFVIVAGDAACLGARDRARALGFKPMLLTTMLEGEAKDAGQFFAAIVREIHTNKRPIEPPCAIIAGGENVVTIGSTPRGDGGPNQEFALSASLHIRGMDGVLIASIDTDGSDGSTALAGAMVDGSTYFSARAKGLIVSESLRTHNASFILREIGEAIDTGPTGTNVNDLKLALIGSSEEIT
jgi:glycerate 2-kinase